MQQEHLDLDIEEVAFDHENPRIRLALEKYGDKINAERIAFALKTASPDDNSSTASFNKLRGAIHAYGSIAQPITVTERNGKNVCIDGNTRLAIYKEFDQHDDSGKWKKIPAILISNAKQLDIEKVRVSAHLVGTREWPPYEKARYLHDLYYGGHLEPAQMVALCGGNEKEIRQSIEAFNDMNEYYRDKLDNESEFQIERFSGFVELQKSGVKDAIWKAGFELDDFGQWIHRRQIRKMVDVRQLAKILRDPDAQKIFVEGSMDSITRARQHLEAEDLKRKKGDSTIAEIQNASMEDLVTALIDKLRNMTRSEFAEFRQADASASGSNTVDALQSLNDEIQIFLDEVGE